MAQSSFDVYRSVAAAQSPGRGGSSMTPPAAPNHLTPPKFHLPESTGAAADVIPTFYKPKRKAKTEAQKAFYQECHRMEIERRLKPLVEPQRLWELLLAHRLGAEEGEEASEYDAVRLTYERFRDVALELVSEHEFYTHPLISPKVFLQFERDDDGAVSAVLLFTYVAKKILLYQLRLRMEMYSCPWEYPARLTELEFEQLLESMIPHLRTIALLDESFIPYWMCHATRRFFTHLDTQRRGYIFIDDIMASDTLAELLRLYEVDVEDAQVPPEEIPADLTNNWFSAHIMQRVFNHYTELDDDNNGLLSLDEVSRFNSGYLTRTFLRRVFEVHPTFQGEMDYRKFLEFVLAVEHLDTPYGQRYVWRAIDLGETGALTRPMVKMLCEDVAAGVLSTHNVVLVAEDMMNEVFDMVCPHNGNFITLKDIASCGMAGTVLGILIDHNAFYQYDNRENRAADKAAWDAYV
eukprot:PhM_4_TR7439/c0_g1_i1/m.31889/K11583/PPP2R3; serine/threonine-protein phosphatase 2A regulatory subunit B''